MASLGTGQLLWFRRCCVALGNPSASPCIDPTPPNGSYDMKFYAEVTGDFTAGETEDTYSNLKVRFYMTGEDHGYNSMCPDEDGGYLAGCADPLKIYGNTNANGTNYQLVWTAPSTKNLPSQSLGSISMSGTIKVPAGQTVNLHVGKGVACKETPFTIPLRKEKPDLTQCTTPTLNLRCSGSTSNVYAGQVSFGGSYGINTDSDGNDRNTRSDRWTITPGGLSGSNQGQIGGLSPNSTYTINVRRSNGCASTSASCTFTTLVGNEPVSCKSYKSNEIQVEYNIIGGYGVYEPVTTFRYRKTGTSTWTTIEWDSHTKTKTTAHFTGLERDTQYDLQACTTTPAGTYCGEIISCRTIPGAYAVIDSTDPFIYPDPEGVLPDDTRCIVCYSWRADCAPVTTQLFYRVKNGISQVWLPAEPYTSDERSGSHCVTLTHLIPNLTTYECYVKATGCDGVTWDSGIAEFVTPLQKSPADYNCESLTYLVELICQALEAIKEGNKTIYANAASKEHCDPDSENPTMATFWSRVFRWSGAAACIFCEMMENAIKSGKKDQYFTGELGWVDIQKELPDSYEEGDNDGKILASSGAVHDLISRRLHEVWHYHIAVDYILDNLDNVPENANSVINLSDNKIYIKDGENWVLAPDEDQPDDFAVYHVNYSSETERYGIVPAESAWYYWDGTWNNLDSNASDIEDALNRIDEEIGNTVTYPEGKQKAIQVVDSNFNFGSSNITPNTIYFVTEADTSDPAQYFEVKYVDINGTVLRTERVLNGAIASGYTPDYTPGRRLQGWTVDGVTWDFNNPVVQPLTLTSVWKFDEYTVSFDLNGGTGETPAPITGLHYGDTITLPSGDGIEKEGQVFGGWMHRLNYLWSNNLQVFGDMTLKAYWTAVMVTVAIRRSSDLPDEIIQVPYGSTILAPDPQTPPGYDFIGWTTESGEPFDFSQPITSNTVIVAQYELTLVTVSFDAQTLPEYADETVVNPEDQVIPRGSVATEPVVTANDYILWYWTLNGERFNFDTPVSQDIHLVAVWAEAVDVEFDANGGTPVPEPQRVPYGGNAERPADPVKEGCEFLGWAELNTHTVTVYPNNGNKPYKIHVLDGEVANTPADPEIEGCRFAGWTTEYTLPPNTGDDDTIQPAPAGYHNVVFYRRNGQKPLVVQVEDGKTLPVIFNPKRQNCRFTGWTTDGDIKTVTFDPKNADGSGVYSLEVVAGDKIDPAPKGSHHSGCEFVGWFIEEDNNSNNNSEGE